VNMSLYTAGDEQATCASTQAMLRAWGCELFGVSSVILCPDSVLSVREVVRVGPTQWCPLPNRVAVGT